MYSQAVTHPSTNIAQCCLTSVIGRELVCSTWYGRRQDDGGNFGKTANRSKVESKKRQSGLENFWSAQSGFRKRPIMSNGPYTSRTSFKGLEMIYALLVSGEVGRSWRYCNAKPTREKAGASSWTFSPDKNQFNIEGGTWPPYQILSW